MYYNLKPFFNFVVKESTWDRTLLSCPILAPVFETLFNTKSVALHRRISRL